MATHKLATLLSWSLCFLHGPPVVIEGFGFVRRIGLGVSGEFEMQSFPDRGTGCLYVLFLFRLRSDCLSLRPASILIISRP